MNNDKLIKVLEGIQDLIGEYIYEQSEEFAEEQRLKEIPDILNPNLSISDRCKGLSIVGLECSLDKVVSLDLNYSSPPDVYNTKAVIAIDKLASDTDEEITNDLRSMSKQIGKEIDYIKYTDGALSIKFMHDLGIFKIPLAAGKGKCSLSVVMIYGYRSPYKALKLMRTNTLTETEYYE